MRRNMGMKLIAVGTILGYSSVSVVNPIAHVRAEEVSFSESETVLKSIEVEEFQLDQVFSPEVNAYTASVGSNIKYMSLVLDKLEETAAVIKINGEAVEGGEKTILPLVTGTNSFVITVANGTEVSTYTMTITRAKNDNSKLSHLSLSNGSIPFDPEVTSYQIEVNNDISQLTVNAKAADDTATLQINGSTIENAEEDHLIELPVGSSTIAISVTAENGSIQTYNVTVLRKEKEEVKQGPITNVEDKDKSNDTTNQTPSTNNKSDLSQDTTVSTTYGTRSTGNIESVSVSNGSNTRTSDNNTMSEESGGETLTTANLASLTVSNGTWNKSFSSTEYTYHLSLANDVTSLTISAVAEENDAEIYMEDKLITNSSTVTIDDKAKTVISIVVKHDSDRKTYVLVFDKTIDEEANSVTTESTIDKETDATEVSVDTSRDNARTLANERSSSLTGRQVEATSFWQKLLSVFGL